MLSSTVSKKQKTPSTDKRMSVLKREIKACPRAGLYDDLNIKTIP